MFRTHVGQLAIGASAVLLLALAPAGVATASAGSGGLPCPRAPPFDADNFHHPTQIDNEFLPMVPGTRHVYTGTTSWGRPPDRQHRDRPDQGRGRRDGAGDPGGRHPGRPGRRVGAHPLRAGRPGRCVEPGRVSRDRSTTTGRSPAPRAPGWPARSAPGPASTCWPHPESPRRSATCSTCRAMPPSIDFLDCARVHSVDRTTTVPVGTFHDVLTTWETSPLESTERDPDQGARTRASASSG